jgi:23S rRNA 5-hydroxycytidine C2501 synthase
MNKKEKKDLTPHGGSGSVLELLAPARDFATGKVAVLAGADAVYIGGPKFGARQAAGNSWEDIEELVKFAHQYYVKIYVAINTIFYDAEAESVKESMQKAYDIGADAVIIQDMGILEMDLPPIPLIASTQCHNYTASHIKFLEEAGFSRVILARELSLEQIKEIRAKTKIDLEFFVHGALCVSFSGRCYFSQAICQKSANRGGCMQACRLQYSLIDADGKELARDKYLLSLKDFNLSASLKNLIDAGITSFKIEGRLKDESYVANTVAKYSQELNKIIEESEGKYKRASSGRVELKFEPDLERTFNRGYTDYFLNGRLPASDIVSASTQKSLGKFLGKVKNPPTGIKNDYFTLDRKSDLQNGDGICWFNKKDELVGTNINTVEGDRIYPNKFIPQRAGIDIYRNSDPAFDKKVANGADRGVAVDFTLKETENGFSINAKDEDKNFAEMEFEAEKKPAQKPDMVEANWKQQLSKLGDTVFYARDFSFDFKKPYFIPLSALNGWRREVALKLSETRAKNYPRISSDHKKTDHLYPEKELSTFGGQNGPSVSTSEGLNYTFNVANSLSKSFYERHGAKVTENAFELQGNTKGKKVMTTKYCLKQLFGGCPKQWDTCPEGQGRRGRTDFKEPLYLVNQGRRYRVSFDCKNCQMEIWN